MQVRLNSTKAVRIVHVLMADCQGDIRHWTGAAAALYAEIGR